jgi:hypothetical protein
VDGGAAERGAADGEGAADTAGVAAGVAVGAGAVSFGVPEGPAVAGADEGMAWDPPQAATRKMASSSDEVVSERCIECLPSGSGARGSSREIRQQPSDGMA